VFLQRHEEHLCNVFAARLASVNDTLVSDVGDLVAPASSQLVDRDFRRTCLSYL
ncbi:hypothetical protein DYB38_009294, partial [Aphanomyces astaci]